MSTRVTVLGSGDAFSGCGCNAACLLDDRVLVDCGAPAQVMLRRAGVGVEDIELVLLTHFHADHSFMLPLLLGARAFAGPSQRGLTIAGPVGTREYVRRLVYTGYGKHLVNTIEDRLGPSWACLQDGDEVVIAGRTVRAHAVVHSTGPSLAYTVQKGDDAVVGFSGDSTVCAGLHRVLAAADLVVCECTGWDGPVEGGHLWRGELEELIAAHPSTRFVLTHMSQRGTVPGAITAHDLLSLDVSRIEA